ncbi:MAG: hypothetical protein AAGI92_10715 [Pseudomonadota bacterium]
MRLRTAAILALCVATAGCVIENGPRRGGPVAIQPMGLEGQWQNTQGLYSASFSNSSTVWVDTQTGETLIRGSYQQLSPTDYALVLTSEESGQTRRANCRLFGRNQLNCSRDDGNQFSMVRLAT